MNRIAVLIAALGVSAMAVACSSDSGGPGGPDGSTETGGAGSGGKGSGGKGSGGSQTGGSSGMGGNHTGGGGGSGGTVPEGGVDGGCVPPSYLTYHSPGCGGSVTPTCDPPPKEPVDAGLLSACACDGTTILGGYGFLKPDRALGECPATDSGTDSGSDAH